MIVLQYKFYNVDIDSYSLNQEVFLFRESDEQMLSAINFLGGGTWMVFLEQDTTITSYEWFPKQGDDDSSPEMVLRRVSYKVDNDGYFYRTKIVDPYEVGIILYGKVQDSDGWTNVRQSPDIISKVIYKALSGSYIYVEKVYSTNWGRVIQCQMGDSQELKFKRGGYIHLSRVK